MGFKLVFIGPGGGVLNSFFARGWGIRPLKNARGGEGMVRLGID